MRLTPDSQGFPRAVRFAVVEQATKEVRHDPQADGDRGHGRSVRAPRRRRRSPRRQSGHDHDCDDHDGDDNAGDDDHTGDDARPVDDPPLPGYGRDIVLLRVAV
jgi:hypothetical protein